MTQPAILGGKYQIARRLGEGGMGAVYEATHVATGRRVAVKVVLAEDLLQHTEIVSRFEREARAAGALATQHIVQVLDAGADPQTGHPFMVMELLDGEDLQHTLRRLGPLPIDLALRIVAQTCIGLQDAHDHGVVHRDIKPANLFLSKREEGERIVKVLDFGIAKIKMDQLGAGSDHALTRTGSMLGSPLYMSPEQAQGLKSVDHRTDIWSLGAVLFESLSGTVPHAQDTLGSLILAICSGDAPPVQKLAPWVPPQVAEIVHKALQRNPEDRFPTAAAMGEAVRMLLPQGRAIHESMLRRLSEKETWVVSGAYEIPVALDAQASTSPRGTTTTSGMESSRQASAPRRPAWVGLVAALAVAAVSIGAWKLRARQVAQPAEHAVRTDAVLDAQPSAINSVQVAEIRTVTLGVEPGNARVTIDGTSEPVVDGFVGLKGQLGSVHTVRIRVGESELVKQVVVAESGAIPSAIAWLPPAAANPIPVAPVPGSKTASGKKTPPPATVDPQPSAPTTAPPSKIVTKFDP